MIRIWCWVHASTSLVSTKDGRLLGPSTLRHGLWQIGNHLNLQASPSRKVDANGRNNFLPTKNSPCKTQSMDSSASTGHDHAGACICSIASLLETQAHNGNSSPSHNCPGGCMAVKQGDIIRASVPLIPIGPTTPLSCPQFFTITYQHSQCILIMSLSVLGGKGVGPKVYFFN